MIYTAMGVTFIGVWLWGISDLSAYPGDDSIHMAWVCV